MAVERIPSSSLLGGLFDRMNRTKMDVSRVPGKRHDRHPRGGRKCGGCHRTLTRVEQQMIKTTGRRRCFSCRGLHEGKEMADAARAIQRRVKVRKDKAHTCSQCGQVKKTVQERGTSGPSHKEQFCTKCWNALVRRGAKILDVRVERSLLSGKVVT